MSRARRDPVRIELLKNALTAIADEMAVTVVRTARSFVIKEALDFSTGLMDARGALIAQGLCLPLHMGSFPPTMRSILRDYGDDVRPGDVFATNDPYLGGGTHLPDVYLFKPVFLDDELLGFAATIGHQTDIGGRVPGGNACDNTEIYQEGVRIPPLRIFSNDEPDEVFFKLMRANVRVSEKVLGDIMATVAACRHGEKGLRALARRYGVDAVKGYMEDLVEYAEELTRAELHSLPDGRWEFEDFLDDDGFQEDPIRIHVALTKEGDTLQADFGGTSPQVKGSINLPHSFTCSATYACVRSVLDPSIPNNEGFFRPIEVRTEPGSFVDCTHPAPVAARGLGVMRVTDCLWGALARMLPKKVFACGVQGDYGVTIAGYRPEGQPFVSLEFLFSGWGGRPTKDGIDGISSLAVNYANTPAEVVEVEQPIRIERYGFLPDTGGAGKHRGSLGMVREYRLVGADEAVLQVRGDRQKFQPFGLYGGKPGAFAASAINPDSDDPKVPPGKFMTTMVKGDVFRATLAGGGGWGEPLEREAALVLDDVLNEKVSPEGARREYGVEIDIGTMRVDEEATRKRRADRANPERDRESERVPGRVVTREPRAEEQSRRTDDDVVVKVVDLHKYFGDLEVLKGLSLEVHQGDVLTLLGASGSGKTTLLRCINFLEEPTSGEIRIDGRPMGFRIDRNGRRHRARQSEIDSMRMDIGMVFQQFNVWPHLTAFENIIEGPLRVRKQPREEVEAMAVGLLEKIGLLDKKDQYPARLSGGQQQRVAIARALAMQPKVMLFDEPTSSLDPELIAEVLAVMRTLAAEGTTMIVVTHEIGFAREVSDRVMLLANGLIEEEGTPEEVILNPKSKRSRQFFSALLH